jgi:hypothetical protein
MIIQKSIANFRVLLISEMFGPKSDEITGECRTIRNEELNDLYCSPTVCG